MLYALCSIVYICSLLLSNSLSLFKLNCIQHARCKEMLKVTGPEGTAVGRSGERRGILAPNLHRNGGSSPSFPQPRDALYAF